MSRRVLPLGLILNKNESFDTYYNVGSGVPTGGLNRSVRRALVRRTGWRPAPITPTNPKGFVKCTGLCFPPRNPVRPYKNI
tara:strand:- start:628 stop:870 length:243 start_codon:yes stop_codon:yes gene_type:complete